MRGNAFPEVYTRLTAIRIDLRTTYDLRSAHAPCARRPRAHPPALAGERARGADTEGQGARSNAVRPDIRADAQQQAGIAT